MHVKLVENHFNRRVCQNDNIITLHRGLGLNDYSIIQGGGYAQMILGGGGGLLGSPKVIM